MESRSSRRLALAFSAFAALAPSSSAAQTRPPRASPTLSEHAVEGTSVRRMQAETVVEAPFETVRARILDYERYREFLVRVRESRVVRRNRADTDVYFQLELPRAMGTLWFVQRMNVVERTPNRLEIVGLAQSGNVGRVETRVVVERVRGARPSTRLTFALFGLPVVPALPDTVNTALRDAVRWASVFLQTRVESEASADNTLR